MHKVITMNQKSKYHIKIPMLVLFFVFSAMIYSASADDAGDFSMKSNVNDLVKLMTKWSKQLSSGNVTPAAQKKLSELIAESCRVLEDISTKSGHGMNKKHYKKIKKMEAEWDPFDLSDRM